jgi:hypothetical protein
MTPVCAVLNHPNGRRALQRIVPALLVLLLLGCATTQDLAESEAPPPEPSTRSAERVTNQADDARWYYLRFQFHRDAEGEAMSFLDLLVANEIVAPVLERERDGIRLWRFHRRWPDDATGHQFSFIVLTDPARLAVIDDAIRRQPALDMLRADGHLRRYRVDAVKGDAPGALAATSDRSWPPLLQREWPHFIQGASRMWLGLVGAEVARTEGVDRYERYAAAAEAVDDLWFEEANHALFHHLSALFGYQPVLVIRRDIMTF